jgi:hypothetical protein
MILEEKYTLSNGKEIPKLGFGTWFISDTDVVQAVIVAVVFHRSTSCGEGTPDIPGRFSTTGCLD